MTLSVKHYLLKTEENLSRRSLIQTATTPSTNLLLMSSKT